MEQNPKPKLFSKPWVQSLSGIVVITLLIGGALVYKSISYKVAIDMSVVEAPTILIGPQVPGILGAVYVRAGDTVKAGEALALVGSETLSAKIDGQIIQVQNNPGQLFTPGSPVVTMIDPEAMRVVGTLDENKGLSLIKLGNPVSFTVDAFGGKKFTGRVDEISPTSNDTGVAFTISDKRETRTFNVKVAYDIAANPEFKNGMSAKMQIYIK